MRLISFLVMVFGALLSQYLLQTWLVNSEEEKKESWESVVKVSSDIYSRSLKDLQWLTRDSNWKYLFLVPSRAKAYQERKDQETRGRSNTIIGEYTFNGIKFRITDPDHDSDDWISEETEQTNAGEDTRSSASSSGECGRVLHQETGGAVPEEEYLASSRTPRHPRPTSVKYRIGQVVKHRKYGYYGVIVGWDEVAKAPEDWFRQNHPKGKEHWRRMPNYSVMVDQKYNRGNYAYCAEENIVSVRNVQIHHPDLSETFSHYDGTRYIAQPWLQEIYPHDQVEADK